MKLQGVDVPDFLYGTAWKEDETERLVRLALAAGFRGIDTANQRKHYHEAGVGAAIAGTSGLFVQTKFTSRDGQDQRLPYDPKASLTEQVAQSFASSCAHLGVARIDSYVLHGPMTRVALVAEDLEIWRAMETLHEAGRTSLLGVSNINLRQLTELWGAARVKPAMVQNRCYASTGWDRAVRAFCRDHDMGYQGFSLLTANREVVGHARVHKIAARAGMTPAQVILAFARQVGMIVLTGTTSAEHMAQDLAVTTLEPADVADLEAMSG